MFIKSSFLSRISVMSTTCLTMPAPVDIWLSAAIPLLDRIKTSSCPSGYYLDDFDLVSDVQRFVSGIQSYRLMYPDIFSLASNLESFAELDRVVDEILAYTKVPKPEVQSCQAV